MEKKFEELIEKFLLSLVNEEILPLEIPTNNSYSMEMDEVTYSRRLLENPTSARKYSQVFAVAALLCELHTEKKTISQRDVYYTLKGIFNNQSECNSIIVELGRIMGLKRFEFGICPTTRGYVAGRLRFKRFSDDDWTECSCGTTDWSIPISSLWSRAVHASSTSNPDDLVLVESDAVYLLLVEKEGIFHRLVEDRLYEKIPCILVTACGNPDIATRSLVSLLTRECENLIVLGICDYNPSGISLLLTYKYGSTSMSFEGEGLDIGDQMRWLGLRSNHIERLEVSPEVSKEYSQPLSVRDKKMLQSFLSSSCSSRNGQTLGSQINNDDQYRTFQEEIEIMYAGDVKYELEAFYHFGITHVTDMIENSIKTRDYI